MRQAVSYGAIMATKEALTCRWLPTKLHEHACECPSLEDSLWANLWPVSSSITGWALKHIATTSGKLMGHVPRERQSMLSKTSEPSTSAHVLSVALSCCHHTCCTVSQSHHRARLHQIHRQHLHPTSYVHSLNSHCFLLPHRPTSRCPYSLNHRHRRG